MKLNGIPENNFLCIFIIASSPGVHTFFCLWRVNKKLPRGETSQNAFSEVKVNQFKVKSMHVRMGISTFNKDNNCNLLVCDNSIVYIGSQVNKKCDLLCKYFIFGA